MTDDQHGEGTPQGGGRWDPLPQGDYDDGATAFVKLPEGGVDALLAGRGDSPLAAPGHGYVPPQITVTPATTAGTDPASTGAWAVPGAPVDGAQWHDPHGAAAQHGGQGEYQQHDGHGDPHGEHQQHGGQGEYQRHDPGAAAQPHTAHDRFTYNPGATGQWNLEEAAAAESAASGAPGHDVTGQWSIPVAGGDLPDESGEFTTSSLVEQWGGTPPATLPGGAPAPWATQATGQPWGQQAAEHATGAEHAPGGPGHGPEQAGTHGLTPDQAASGHAPGRTADGPHTSEQPEQAVGAHEQTAGAHAHEQTADAHARAQTAGAHVHERATGASTPAEPEQGGPEHGAASHAPEPAGAVGHAHEGYPYEPSGAAGHGPERSPAAGRAHGEPDSEGPEEAAGHAPAASPEPYPEAAGAQVPTEAAPEPSPESPESPESPQRTDSEAARTASQSAPAAGEVPEAPDGTQGAAEAAESPSEPPTDTAPTEQPEPEPEAADAAETAGASDAPDGTDAPGAQAPHDASPVPGDEEHPLASYVLRVNGTDRPVNDAWIGESLLYVLRERLGLAGAKDGCSQGECGACNVQVDGRLVASCLVPAVTAAGSEVRTVEGLAVDGQPSDVQRALARCGAVQCGFCVPGMAMTVHDLLEGNPAPSELETRQALCGNLCRCSGYRGVVEAVKEVVAEREAHAGADGTEPAADEPRIPHQAGPGAGGVHPEAFPPPGPHDQPYGQDGGHA
ncbi:2Fe-2S iron-sulfur cluster-binding protein [Streptomyces bullii]|uniref:2Fe-2S iron-sulfur cluster-binding protein n=1 Tax=Streptomyces bullii TaxID=349910 RepID=A0ABW0UH67_9ACTN